MPKLRAAILKRRDEGKDRNDHPRLLPEKATNALTLKTNLTRRLAYKLIREHRRDLWPILISSTLLWLFGNPQIRLNRLEAGELLRRFVIETAPVMITSSPGFQFTA